MQSKNYFQPHAVSFQKEKIGHSTYLRNENELTKNPEILKFNWAIFFHRFLCISISMFWFYIIISTAISEISWKINQSSILYPYPTMADPFGEIHFYDTLLIVAIFSLDKSVKIWGSIGNYYLKITMMVNLILTGGILFNFSIMNKNSIGYILALIMFLGSLYIFYITYVFANHYPNQMLTVESSVLIYKKTSHFRVPTIILLPLLYLWVGSYFIDWIFILFGYNPNGGNAAQSFWVLFYERINGISFNFTILGIILVLIALFCFFDIFIKAEHTANKRGAFYIPTNSKILVVGAGAIGGITGAYLTLAGEKVILYDTNKDHIQTMRDNGLELTGKRGNLWVKVCTASDNEELIDQYNKLFDTSNETPQFDFIIIGVKSAYTEIAVQNAIQFMAPEGAICTVQNSINDETIAELIGADKVIHCVTLWGGSNIGPGKLEQTSLSPFCIGEYGENKNTTRISTLKQILGNVTKTKIFNNILQAAWRKLVLNGVLNTYGLIFGERSYVIFNNPQILPLVLATMREETCIAQDIVGELGKESVISIDKFGIDLNSPLSEIQKNAFACKIMTTVNGRIKSSMLQDYEHGIKTENEYLAGYFIRENQKNAEHKKKDPFAIPFIQRSFEIAQKVENGDLNPNLENLQYFTDLIETLPTTWQNPENFKLDNTKQKLKLALYGILGSLIVGK